MNSVDLNADLGEGMGHDEALLAIVSSASVACGGHAGSPEIMERTLRAAKQGGVRTGAHPGFVDRENFGRVVLDLPVKTIAAQVIAQVQAIGAIAEKVGQKIAYVKLHGALYNRASGDYEFARTIFAALREIDPSPAILALDNSAQLRAAADLGLKTIAEAFADRAYEANGLLVSRAQRGAVFSDPAQAVVQALSIACKGRITAIDGANLKSNAKSICLHGDNAAALQIARSIRDALAQAGITISSGAD